MLFINVKNKRCRNFMVAVASWIFFILKLCMVAVFGLVAVLYGWSWLDPGEDETSYDIGRYPKGEYTAVHTLTAGGGAISPYCIESIFIERSGKTMQHEHDRGAAVFSYPCSPGHLRIVWSDQATLSISLSTNKLYREQMHLRRLDDSGKIKINVELSK